MRTFEFEKLHVFQRSLDYAIVSEEISDLLPAKRNYLADQIRRAASSISLNICEGAGEYRRREKGRFYRYARRSATESAGAVIYIEKLRLVPAELTARAREPLHELVCMLTTMVRANMDGGKRQGKVKGKVKAKGAGGSAAGDATPRRTA